MTPPKTSRRELERAILALEARYEKLAGHTKILAGAVVYMMHERGETVIDVTIPPWVYKQDCHVGSAMNDDNSIVVTRNAYLRPPVDTAEIEEAAE